MAIRSSRDVIYMLCLIMTAYSLVLAQTPRCNGTQLAIRTQKCFDDQGVAPVDQGLAEVQVICSKRAEYKSALNCIQETVNSCDMTGGDAGLGTTGVAVDDAIDYLCDHQQDVNMTCYDNLLSESMQCFQQAEDFYRKTLTYQNLTSPQKICLTKRIVRDCTSVLLTCGSSTVQVLIRVIELLNPTCFKLDEDIDLLHCSRPRYQQPDFDICYAREGLTPPDLFSDVLNMCSQKTAYIRALTCTQAESLLCARALAVEDFTLVIDYRKPLNYLCQHKAELNQTCIDREHQKINCTVGHEGLSTKQQICQTYKNMTVECIVAELSDCDQQTVEVISNFYRLTAENCGNSTAGLDNENSAVLQAVTVTVLYTLLFISLLYPYLITH